jgi:hypothetical protein
MAQSIIVQSIIDALSSSDPALLATSTETARIDVNCGDQDPKTPLLSMESILFPKQMRAISKVIPSGGCIVKQTSSKPGDSDIIEKKIAIFKNELTRKILVLDKKDLMSVKFEISRLIYDIFVNDDISNETVANFPNVYLYNYRKEGLLDRPGGELNRRFKKISDFFFIPSDAIFGIFEVIKEAEKNDTTNIWTTLFSKISGIAIDFEKFGSPTLKTEDNLVKLMIEFIPFFNYTENEIKGQNGATLEPRYHGGYYTIFNQISADPNSNIIVKLPDFTARNYRGNSTSFHEDFQLSGDESVTLIHIHNKKEDEDVRTNIELEFDPVFSAEIVDYEDSFTSLQEQLTYKYILDIDGWSNTWDATIWKLYSGSILFKVKSTWQQWYYDELKEWEHYVPINNDFSDLNEKIEWCKLNDDKCKQIAKNAKKFVIEKLNLEYVNNKVVERTIKYFNDTNQ